MHHKKAPSSQACGERRCEKIKPHRGKIITVIVNELQELVHLALAVVVLIVAMQYLIVFLMLLKELIDHPLLLIEISCLLEF